MTHPVWAAELPMPRFALERRRAGRPDDGLRRARGHVGHGPRPGAVLLFAAQALAPSHSLGTISGVPHHGVSCNRTHRGRVPPVWRGCAGKRDPRTACRGPGVSWRCASGVGHAPALEHTDPPTSRLRGRFSHGTEDSSRRIEPCWRETRLMRVTLILRCQFTWADPLLFPLALN